MWKVELQNFTGVKNLAMDYDVSDYQLTSVYEWGAVPENLICLEVPLLVVVTDIAEVATRLEL